jgi:hypothetical protein
MGYINYEKAINIFEKHLNGKVNASQEIWKWINLDLWLKMIGNNYTKNNLHSDKMP